MPTIKYAAAVNLGNYESLRVEVEGEDADTAKMALDQALASIQGDADNPAVVDAIARYRKGVLGRSGLQIPEPALAPATPETPKPAKAPMPEKPAPTPEPAPVNKYDNGMPDKSPDDDLPYQQTEKPAQAASQPKPTPAPSPKPADGDETCEKCGCAIPKAQGKLSRLFMNKTLCKKCMDQNGGA